MAPPTFEANAQNATNGLYSVQHQVITGARPPTTHQRRGRQVCRRGSSGGGRLLLGQATRAITAPWIISWFSSSRRVITPDACGYTSASTLSTATSAIRVDGVTSSP